jgi:hypothetical protein
MSSNVYAYLSICGFTCGADTVGSLVGLPAQLIQLVGERTRGGRLITENSWSGKPPVPAGEEQPDFYVSAVLDHIAARPPELAEFLRQHDSGINCVGYFRRVNGGFHMERELVSRCAALGLWLDFDLYNYTVKDEP